MGKKSKTKKNEDPLLKQLLVPRVGPVGGGTSIFDDPRTTYKTTGSGAKHRRESANLLISGHWQSEIPQRPRDDIDKLLDRLYNEFETNLERLKSDALNDAINPPGRFKDTGKDKEPKKDTGPRSVWGWIDKQLERNRPKDPDTDEWFDDTADPVATQDTDEPNPPLNRPEGVFVDDDNTLDVPEEPTPDKEHPKDPPDEREECETLERLLRDTGIIDKDTSICSRGGKAGSGGFHITGSLGRH